MSLKLTDYIVAGLLVGLFVTVLISASLQFVEHYGSDNVTAEFEGYDKYNDTISQIKQIDNTTKNVRAKEGVFDLIGDFFSQGYSAFKLTRNSVDIVSDIGSNAIDKAELGDTGGAFKAYFAAIILVIFILGILAVLIGKEI